MHKLRLIAALAALSTTVSANALTSGFTSVEPAGAVNYAFDNLAGNADLSISNGTIRSGDSAGLAVAPLGGAGNYYSVDPLHTPGIITFTNGLSSLSFLWGSPDAYNTLTVTTNLGSTVISPFATGGLNSNTRYLTLTAGVGESIKSLKLESSAYAFEIDSLRYAVAPVPEPATWAMMIGGLGLVGLQMRRRKATVSFA